MRGLIDDLIAHQAWADATLFDAIGRHPAARVDRVTRERLHHLHIVQRSFMWSLGDRAIPFEFSTPEDFPQFEDLRRFARGSHAIVAGTMAGLTAERLAAPVQIPWFQDPPLTIRVDEALTQCAMHSQWHRGQNAVRLRELGGNPPTIDLIVWYWKGRPAPAWND
jgi:uncharacterized damage-inducible protein DinB